MLLDASPKCKSSTMRAFQFCELGSISNPRLIELPGLTASLQQRLVTVAAGAIGPNDVKNVDYLGSWLGVHSKRHALHDNKAR
jgi:hypothetical protein